MAFALGHPGFGLARISAELRRPKWAGSCLTPNGVVAGPSVPNSGPMKKQSIWTSSRGLSTCRWRLGLGFEAVMSDGASELRWAF